MKKAIVLLLTCILTLTSYSQSVDLDREYMNVSYVRLPANPVLDAAYRTYSVQVSSSSSSSYSTDMIKDKIIIEGFEKVNSGGTIDVQVQIGSVVINSSDITKREQVKKDKEGKVISRKTYYTPVITYSTEGSYYLKDHTENPPNYSLGYQKTHEGSETSSYSAASKYISNNRSSLRSKFRKTFINGIAGRVNGKINYRYGYSQMEYKVLLWILDSKKNSETVGHKKALADMQAAYGAMKFDSPLDNLKKDAQPIITYFESVIPKFSEVKKKKHRKMRYASYFNIAYMYYYLDMPDKVIEYANKLIENDYDKGDGKALLKKAEVLKKRFEANEIDSRHFTVVTTDNSTQGNYEDFAEGDENGETAPTENYLETVLTTSDNKTVEGKIKVELEADANADSLDLTNYMNGTVKIMTLTDAEEIEEVIFAPKDNVSFTVNNSTYASLKYKPAKEKEVTTGSVVDASGAENVFARVIYTSDKLGLYAYQGELIFKKASENLGQSTSSMVWNIGFKKKLSKLVEGCEVLNARINSGGFKNDEKSLTIFIKEYTTSCP